MMANFIWSILAFRRLGQVLGKVIARFHLGLGRSRVLRALVWVGATDQQ